MENKPRVVVVPFGASDMVAMSPERFPTEWIARLQLDYDPPSTVTLPVDESWRRVAGRYWSQRSGNMEPFIGAYTAAVLAPTEAMRRMLEFLVEREVRKVKLDA